MSHTRMPDEVMDALAYYPETCECIDACVLDIEHKKIQYAKLLKPKKVVLKITGDEDFDMYSQGDLGPLTWMKESFNVKKNSLKVQAIVPAGLRPGTVRSGLEAASVRLKLYRNALCTGCRRRTG